MNRDEFLQLEHVDGFINWLVDTVPNMRFKLNFLPSRYVPGGLRVTAIGLEQVLSHYNWHSSWTDEEGVNVASSDWPSTRSSLKQLSEKVRSSVHDRDENATYNACRAILHWGGVTGAIPFLNNLRETSNLVNYLNRLEPLMTLVGNQHLDNLDASAVLRFDAGITKIHALIDDTGSPIYDSRVGASIGMLYALYAEANPNFPNRLAFPSGAARGDQVRNPSGLGHSAAPQFFTRAVTTEMWAQWQVKLGWIIRRTLEACPWFNDEINMSARCHAFEAALFMVGYDLRCFNGGDAPDVPPRPNEGLKQNSNWVPASHPFQDLVRKYAEFRLNVMPNGGTKADFVQYLMEVDGRTRAAARSYTFPLSINEFDMIGSPLERVQLIAEGGRSGLYAATGGENYRAGDERCSVCLVDAWIVGVLGSINVDDHDSVTYRERLIRGGFAGTKNAANTLLYVGRGVGRHFGLLDQDDNPTNLYVEFFGGEFDDFIPRLE
jgi:hypothetical protein